MFFGHSIKRSFLVKVENRRIVATLRRPFAPLGSMGHGGLTGLLEGIILASLVYLPFKNSRLSWRPIQIIDFPPPLPYSPSHTSRFIQPRCCADEYVPTR